MAEPFGEFLRREREERGLTLQEVGGRMSTSHATIQRYETGKRDVDFDVALQLADAIGVARRKVTEAWILAHGGDRSLVVGVQIPEAQNIPDDEYLQDSLMAYSGPSPILRAAKAAAMGQQMISAEEMAQKLRDAEAAGSVGGESGRPLPRLGRGPRKGITKIDE